MPKQTPLFVRDIERLRPNLNVPASDRVRLIIESSDNKLVVHMECIACEELLEWVAPKGWWACPVCQNETTEDEAVGLFRLCYELFGTIVGDTDEGGAGTDESEGKGRWLDRFRSLMGI